MATKLSYNIDQNPDTQTLWISVEEGYKTSIEDAEELRDLIDKKH